MSLEECKRLAEEKLAKEKELREEKRYSTGTVDGEDVKLFLSVNPLPWPPKGWAVFVSAYGEISSKHFKKKVPAVRYFEKLTREYGLREEEK